MVQWVWLATAVLEFGPKLMLPCTKFKTFKIGPVLEALNEKKLFAFWIRERDWKAEN